ncbi:MAG: PEP-CTERM sorting domain-containing protein [Phycisphaerae bacterium]|nr:PEP-CTERM sorting domain-containing protein [Phycisphaerae bacterium]
MQMRTKIVGAIVLIGVIWTGAGPAWAGSKVLTGIGDYSTETIRPEDAGTPMSDAGAGGASQSFDTSEAYIRPDGPRPACGGLLPGVPEYGWWYGCSPTAGGMMVGYWDGRPGFGNLYDGNAGVWGGSGASGTKSMVASTAHIVAGDQNGYTYGDWHNSTSYPNHEANPDCIADFMHTVNGGSYTDDIAEGLEAYCQWDKPGTAVNESYQATASFEDVAFWGTAGHAFDYLDFKAEIDAGRPVILDLIAYLPISHRWAGHSVVAYGYQDNMFEVKVPIGGGGDVDLLVGGFAVMDTWSNGTGQSDWYDWDGAILYPTIDGDGVEWWPFVELLGASWTARNDWMVMDAVSLEVVPEPATLALLALGGLVILRRRRRL